MKKYKLRLSLTACNGIMAVLEKVLTEERVYDTIDRLMLASFVDILTLLRKKTVEHKPLHKLTLTAIQALGLQLLYEYYVEPYGTRTGYVENELMRISNEVHQRYYH